MIHKLLNDAETLSPASDHIGTYQKVNGRIYLSCERVAANEREGRFVLEKQNCWELCDLNYSPLGIIIVK